MNWINYKTVFKVDSVKEINISKLKGFTYLITNLVDGRRYIGMKNFYSKRKGVVSESDWRNYCSSSKYLKADIEKLGKAAFRFEILELFTNKAKLKKSESDFILKYNCVTDPNWYNANWNGINRQQMKQLEIHYSRPSVIFDPKTNSLINNS